MVFVQMTLNSEFIPVRFGYFGSRQLDILMCTVKRQADVL